MRALHLIVSVAMSSVLSPLSAWAVDATPLLNVGFEFGGEKLLGFQYTDGSTSSIEAGKGVVLSGGVLMPLMKEGASVYEAQATVGLKTTSSKPATNGEITYSRIPLEVLGFYRQEEMSFRVGGGLTYQINNKINGTGDFAPLSINLKNAFGAIVQADYLAGLTKNLGFGMRYTLISYEGERGTSSVNGNSFGLHFTYFFR